MVCPDCGAAMPGDDGKVLKRSAAPIQVEICKSEMQSW